MTAVLADTSALFALLVATDDNHERAARAFERLADRKVPLVTTNYVLVESYALLARRVGIAAVRRFRASMQPLFDVVWVSRDIHEAALDLVLERPRSGISLVDAVSFVVMRAGGIEEAFAYDRHFRTAGFQLTR